MQTGTARGMQTMEQSLADLVLRRVITREVAVNRSSRADQLEGLVERGVTLTAARAGARDNGLRLAEA
jgi:Tfp pilus assembly ATPase PilU